MSNELIFNLRCGDSNTLTVHEAPDNKIENGNRDCGKETTTKPKRKNNPKPPMGFHSEKSSAWRRDLSCPLNKICTSSDKIDCFCRDVVSNVLLASFYHPLGIFCLFFLTMNSYKLGNYYG